MWSLRGITVKLYEALQTGSDGFNHPTTDSTPVEVENVLVAPASSQEILDSLSLYGRRAVYTLGIPKADAHDWENSIVEFWGHKWRVFGFSTCGIEELVPLSWNKKVQVERIG